MATTTNNQQSGWTGWVYFAALMLVFSGIFQMIAGLTALLNDKYYAITETSLVVFDITVWGWIHLLLGLVVLLAGTALFHGSMWARVVAIFLASLSFIANFAFIGVYPIWSIIMLILCMLVIYALIVHGGDLKE